MPQLGSVSQWILRLKDGNESAAFDIWNRYHGQMQNLANAELGGCPRSVSDEDDVVVSAFAAFLRRTGQGAYATLHTRDDLWRLLAKITRTYAWKQSRFFGRLRRRMTRNRSLDEVQILRQLASSCPPPDVVMACSEAMRTLLEKLDEPELRAVALGRLNGLTNQEIAADQKRSVRTIERRLVLIRGIWNSEIAAT